MGMGQQVVGKRRRQSVNDDTAENANNSRVGKRRRQSVNDDTAENANNSIHPRPIGTGIVKRPIDLHPGLFTDDSLSLGGLVKSKGQVINKYYAAMRRPPNMTCRVESFGRICQKFDERRKRWVCDMGFGGLLHFASHMHLPRQLAYWIMTRIDPITRCFIGTNGRSIHFSKNQVHWILGIPNGERPVPTSKDMSGVVRLKVQNILLKYGKAWETRANKHCSRTYTSVGIPVTGMMMDRLEGHFDPDQEEEFKTLFLIISLQMILCPTQSPRLSTDLLPALSCCMDSLNYDWCELVLNKFLESVSNFGRRFYANGFAGGSGGCSIFAVIFYLDRLNLDPILWDTYPRVKAWSMQRIGYAGKLDRTYSGDYGKLGVIDVAYGERHPKVARDTSGPPQCPTYDDVSALVPSSSRGRRRRADLHGLRWGSKYVFDGTSPPLRVEDTTNHEVVLDLNSVQAWDWEK